MDWSKRYSALTRTEGLQGFLSHVHLVEVADADATVYLVEQGGTQVGELAGRDERIRTQAVVGEELSQVQTLEGEEIVKKPSQYIITTEIKPSLFHAKCIHVGRIQYINTLLGICYYCY